MGNLFEKIPSKGIQGLKDHWRDDLLSGFMVSLIALPLCLGIALASGVPPMAGLIAAIVGGLFMSRITGSNVTISGPAAGLIVVTLGAVESLGGGDSVAGYHYALAAIVVAGIIQVGFGLLKVGKLGDFFPSAAVHGMLAAIGVIIMVKQFFVALGTKAEGHELFEVIGEIPHGFASLNPHIATIALVSLTILIVHPKIKLKLVSAIPAPMWVLMLTIPLSHYFNLFEEHTYTLAGNLYSAGPQYLVQLPASVVDGFAFPDFGKIGYGAFWVAVLSIALVSSIESLLSASAVDTLDPYKRKSDLNRDLVAMGGGSSLSGLIGGLPMISEIVRSSANISNGGKTQWANFFHGGFLLVFLLFGKPIIEQIPLAALAAMLIHVGYKLASPSEFKHVWQIGKSQLLIFSITLITVLATDLIIGIAVGILTKLIIHVVYGAPLKYLFRTKINYEENEGIIHIEHAAVFSNYLSLKSEIEKHTDKEHLILDFEKVNLLDHSFREHIHDLQSEWQKVGKKLDFINKEHLIPVSNHPLAARVANKNGKVKGAITLNAKQLELKRIAMERGWSFDPAKLLSFRAYEGFSLTTIGKLINTENAIHSSHDHGSFIYNELIIDKDLQSKAVDTRLSTLLISLPEGKTLPLFTLEQEGFFDKVQSVAGFDDINFDNHPEFSNKFLLKGQLDGAVRMFFSEQLIELIESHPYYHVESNGKSIIIYRFDESSKVDDVEELIEFAEEFKSLASDLNL